MDLTKILCHLTKILCLLLLAIDAGNNNPYHGFASDDIVGHIMANVTKMKPEYIHFQNIGRMMNSLGYVHTEFDIEVSQPFGVTMTVKNATASRLQFYLVQLEKIVEKNVNQRTWQLDEALDKVRQAVEDGPDSQQYIVWLNQRETLHMFSHLEEVDVQLPPFVIMEELQRWMAVREEVSY